MDSASSASSTARCASGARTAEPAARLPTQSFWCRINSCQPMIRRHMCGFDRGRRSAVETDRAIVHGTWRSRTSPAELLQPQVPGMGASARVWRLENGADSAPLVIEVQDPTVVAQGPGATVSKYVD